MNNYKLVLFDFDGTLADTANDMVGALNELLSINSKAPIPIDTLRPYISDGTPALLKFGFGCVPGEKIFDELRLEFLKIYEENVCVDTALYPGIREILTRCQQTSLPWGIVTNKPEYLTRQILDQLGIIELAACVVGGDTLPQRKPNPEPVIHACNIAGVEPESAIFIGDSSRDMEAGKRARLATIAVAYGYIPPNDDPYRWQADITINSTSEIPQILWKSNLD